MIGTWAGSGNSFTKFTLILRIRSPTCASLGRTTQGHSILKALLRKRAAALTHLGNESPTPPLTFLNLMMEKRDVWRGSSNGVQRSKSVQRACQRVLSKLKALIKTITYDNGKEFSGHRKIAGILQCDIYFAKPYHSWQRGLNEHTNGLVRQYFPKGTDFTKLTQAEVQEIENKLNHRPRKCLEYKTPYEVFSKERRQNVASQC